MIDRAMPGLPLLSQSVYLDLARSKTEMEINSRSWSRRSSRGNPQLRDCGISILTMFAQAM